MKYPALTALIAATALSGCKPGQIPPTAPSASEAALIAAELATIPSEDRLRVAPAIATEIGVRFRCPATPTDFVVLRALRDGFDALLRSRLVEESEAVVDRLRRAANEACGITA